MRPNFPPIGNNILGAHRRRGRGLPGGRRVPQDPARRDDGRNDGAELRGGGAEPVPGVHGAEPGHLPGLVPHLGAGDHRQGGPPQESLFGQGVRGGAPEGRHVHCSVLNYN